MVFENDIYVHENHHGKEIKEIIIDLLSAHPTGGGLKEGRVWQIASDEHLYHYIGGGIRQIVNAEDLNKFGKFLGGHNATTGIPTQGSGTNSLGTADLSIEAGDSWRITTAGTIPGLASGADELAQGDVLIALIDNASLASNFMAIQLNLAESVIDEVQDFTNLAAFPATGQEGIIYIAKDTDIIYIWDGAAYKTVSLPNIIHATNLAAFPATGNTDIIYIADDTDQSYFWDGAAYLPLSSSASNLYTVDGILTGSRTVTAGGYNLTITGTGSLLFSSTTYTETVAGNSTENVGGNKIEAITGSRTSTAAGQNITATGGGNNIVLTTAPDAAMVIPSGADPDSNITTPLNGMIEYDSTDKQFRFYENSAWRTFTQVGANIAHHANFAAFPATGSLDTIYIADDTDSVYFWDGSAYVLISGNNIYSANGLLTGNRTLTGGGFSLTETGLLSKSTTATGNISNTSSGGNVTLTSSTGSVYLAATTEGSNLTIVDEIIGNSAVSTTFTTGATFNVNAAAAIKLDTTSGTGGTAAGANIVLTTGTNGAVVLTGSPDPDTNVAAPIEGMLAHDTTDNDIRAYVGGQWVSLLQDEVQSYTNLAAFPVTGILATVYIAEDTDIAYIWDGAAYKTLAGNLYTTNGTVGTTRIATLTDTLTFTGGQVNITGAGLNSNTNTLVVSNNTEESFVVDDGGHTRIGNTDTVVDANFMLKGDTASNSFSIEEVENSSNEVLFRRTGTGVSRWGVNGTFNTMILSASSLQHLGYFSSQNTAAPNGRGGYFFSQDTNSGLRYISAGSFGATQNNITIGSAVGGDAYQNGYRISITSGGNGRVGIGVNAYNFNSGGGITPGAEVEIVGRTLDNTDYSLLAGGQVAATGLASRVEQFGVRNDGVVFITEFVKASLPSATIDHTGTTGMICVTDEAGGRTLATSDGTNWRRIVDGNIVS